MPFDTTIRGSPKSTQCVGGWIKVKITTWKGKCGWVKLKLTTISTLMHYGDIPYSEVRVRVRIPYPYSEIEFSPYQYRFRTLVFDFNPYRFRFRTMFSNLIRTRTVSVLTF